MHDKNYKLFEKSLIIYLYKSLKQAMTEGTKINEPKI
jgi:hypothetical protein